MSGIIRRIEDDTNILGIMQVTKPFGLRLRLRSKVEVEVHNGLKT